MLLAFGILVGGLIFWGFAGNIIITLDADGVLVKSGGIEYISASYYGQLSDVRARVGDYVQKGEIAARLAQPEIVDRILILKKSIDNTKSGEISDLEEELFLLEERLSRESCIISHTEGQISEVFYKKGDFVKPGDYVFSVIKGGETVKALVAALYFPAEHGKRIKPGMSVRIFPTTIKKEEYGFMFGNVISVSDYPANERRIKELTGSDELAQTFAKEIVLEIMVDLSTSNETFSGYSWSSVDGPPVLIENGTLCSGQVVIDRITPIELILPVLGRILKDNED